MFDSDTVKVMVWKTKQIEYSRWYDNRLHRKRRRNVFIVGKDGKLSTVGCVGYTIGHFYEKYRSAKL